jgi:hypothetical protein
MPQQAASMGGLFDLDRTSLFRVKRQIGAPGGRSNYEDLVPNGKVKL